MNRLPKTAPCAGMAVPVRLREVISECLNAGSFVLGLLVLGMGSGCSESDSSSDGETSGQESTRCKDAVQRSGNVVEVCCDVGETIEKTSMCTYGGFIASCVPVAGNCIMRTNDGEYAVNCGSTRCSECPYAANYDLLVGWCAYN